MTGRELHDLITAARVPKAIQPQCHGLWVIHRAHTDRQAIPGYAWKRVLFEDFTILGRFSEATLHKPWGDIVMEDSYAELEKHAPIWERAAGRVLITGLGLGCVVRGLLASTKIKHIDVLEIDPWIVEIIGAEFSGNPRVTIHTGDALKFQINGRKWDFAWHDIYTEEGNGLPLAMLHTELILKFEKSIKKQGAWNYPEEISRQHALLF